jgi:hypothetical protein
LGYGPHGIGLIKRIRERFPNIPIAVFSDVNEREFYEELRGQGIPSAGIRFQRKKIAGYGGEPDQVLAGFASAAGEIINWLGKKASA